MTYIWFRRLCLIGLVLTFAMPLPPTSVAQGSRVVGTGTPASCTEAALTTALAGGGMITFNCGAAAHTITLTSEKVINTSAIVDGDDLITLSGGGRTRLFRIVNARSLQLNDLTIIDGFVNSDGGAIFVTTGGVLQAQNTTFRNNRTPSTWSGGAVVNYGRAEFAGVIFDTNEGGNAGAVYPRFGGSRTVITNSTFRRNRAINTTDSGWGGAILAWDGAPVSIQDSTFTENTARYGGALYNFPRSQMAITTTTFVSNTAVFEGGALHNRARLTLEASTVQSNIVTDVEGTGGGVYNDGSLLVTSSTIAGNSASRGGGINNDQVADLYNSTVSGNQTATGGGGLRNTSETTLLYTTFTDNTTTLNGASNLLLSDGSIILRGSLVDGGCVGQLSSQGYNLDSGTSCGFTQPTDITDRAALVGVLGAYGGPTATHALFADSAALDAAADANCFPTDQRGVVRPQGAACDIGAVEMSDTLTPPAPAGTCGGSFPATVDATTSSAVPDSALGSGETLEVQGSPTDTRRTLLRFDLGALTRPAFIAEAVLELPLAFTAQTTNVEAWSVDGAWDEGVTWNTQPSATVRLAQGGATQTSADDNVLRLDATVLATQWATGAVSPTDLVLLSPILTAATQWTSRESGVGPRLVITCTPLRPDRYADPATETPPQDAALVQLTAASAQPLEVEFTRGALRFSLFSVTAPATATTALDRATWWFGRYGRVLGLGAQDELQLARRSTDEQHLFFRQIHAGIPVYSAEIAVHLDGARISGVGGNYLADLVLPPTPLVSADTAEDLALTAVDATAVVEGDIQLRYFNGTLVGDRDPETYLVWQVNLRGPLQSAAVLVDAQNGAIRFQELRAFDGYDLDLENGNNQPPQDLCSIFDNDNISPNFSPDAQRLSTNMRRTYDYWRGTFGRDSYDDDGEQIEVNINVRYAFPNASYGLCDLFFFGNNMTTLDIVAHEFTHAVIGQTSRLVYANESGALNESFADIFGYFVDNSSWLIGEGSAAARIPVPGVAGCFAASAIRDMSNPRCFGHPDRYSTRNVAATAVCGNGPTNNDCGFVHSNSGIHNKAAFLLVTGSTFNGRRVNGIGQGKGQVFFYNLLRRLGANSNMFDARNNAVAEAIALRNRGFFSSADVCSVRQAYAAVELGDGDNDCDGVEDLAENNDNDTVPDFRDNCPTVTNQNQSDVDGDGVGDVCDGDDDNDGVPDFNAGVRDNCPTVFNPSQRDNDNDGKGDACDDDDDGDATPDAVDNCPGIANANQSDIDRDRVGDACDGDSDNDRVCNVGGPRSGGVNGIPAGGCVAGQGVSGNLPFQRPADNCSLNANTNQADSDNDGVGDACDRCPGVRSSDNGDPDRDGRGNPCDDDDDNDGVLDFNPDGSPRDNCREVVNPGQEDPNRNGIGIACDAPEFEALVRGVDRIRRIQFRPNSPFRVPVPVCLQCGSPYLPNQFQSQVMIVIPIGFQARIIDSNGLIFARTNATNLAQTLRFTPPPFTGRSFRLGSLARGAIATSSVIPPDDTGFYLELFPLPTADISQEYTVTVTNTNLLPNEIFLPFVRR